MTKASLKPLAFSIGYLVLILVYYELIAPSAWEDASGNLIM